MLTNIKIFAGNLRMHICVNSCTVCQQFCCDDLHAYVYYSIELYGSLCFSFIEFEECALNTFIITISAVGRLTLWLARTLHFLQGI